MFKVAKVREVMWPVTINVPQDGGKAQVHKINVRFEIISQQEADDIVFGRNEEEKDLLNRVLRGWDDTVRDEHGEPLPYNDENKAALLGITYVRNGIFAAYGEASIGGRRKN